MNRISSVNCLSQGIDYPAQHAVSDRHLYDPACPFDFITFLDIGIRTHDNRTDMLFFQVQCHAIYIAWKKQQFACHGIFQTVNQGNTVSDGDDRTGFTDFQSIIITFDLFLDDLTDFFRS